MLRLISAIIIFRQNKFVDCALACNARYIVTEDKHFDELKKVTFPKVDVVSLHEFITILKTELKNIGK